MGVMNILSFAQGEFMMIAMYLSFYFNQILRLDPLIAMPFVIVIMFFFGIVVYKLLITRALKGPVLSQRLITFALGLILVNGTVLLAGGQTKTIQNIAFAGSIDLGLIVVSKQKLVLLFTSLIVTALLFWFMNRTKPGKAIRNSTR